MAKTFTWTTKFSALYGAKGQGSGVDSRVMHGYEAASQTFVKGDPLKIVAGKLTLCVANAVLIATDLFVGFAMQPASGVTNTRLGYSTPDKDGVYTLPCWSGTSGTATTAAMIGVSYGMYNSSVAGVVVDTAETTASKVMFTVVDVVQDNTYTLGDSGGLLAGKFNESLRIGMGIN